MKITIVLGAFFPVPPIMGGAVEKVWFALGQEFARRGHEVIQISRAHPALPQTESIAGVRHIRVAGFAQPRSIIWLKFLDLLYSLRARRALPKADIVVTNTFWLPLLIRERRHGLVYVHVARGPKGQMRWYRNAARLQAVSRAIGDAIIAQTPELRAKVRVLPNALPFRSPDVSADLPREKTILFVGRIHPEKGLEVFLRALRHLPREFVLAWKIKFIGPHETELGGGGRDFFNSLQKLASASGAEVEWHKSVFDEAELSRHYQQARVFVYPSLADTGEAMPVAPLEAMANGCVPFVSNLDCFRDYIHDGANGFVFDHRHGNKEQNLAARLTDVLRLRDDELARIGSAARAVAAEFSSDVVAERYLEDFASLLAADEARVPQYQHQTPA
jgi:glycosyltransferase involved in cell wall biosynthesis